MPPRVHLPPFALGSLTCDYANGGERNRAMEFSRLNPFRRSWSVRIGHVRIFSVPWYWDVCRARLADAVAAQKNVMPPPSRHDHYCEECDRRWVHEAHPCAIPWAALCAGDLHQGPGTVRQRLGRWLIVVRRDRAELCKQLGESFAADERVTVVLDRRQSDRRGRRPRKAPVTGERRHSSDRRTPPTDPDRSIWATLGFGAHPDRSSMQGD
jgi:hypothetical protein